MCPVGVAWVGGGAQKRNCLNVWARAKSGGACEGGERNEAMPPPQPPQMRTAGKTTCLCQRHQTPNWPPLTRVVGLFQEQHWSSRSLKCSCSRWCTGDYCGSSPLEVDPLCACTFEAHHPRTTLCLSVPVPRRGYRRGDATPLREGAQGPGSIVTPGGGSLQAYFPHPLLLGSRGWAHQMTSHTNSKSHTSNAQCIPPQGRALHPPVQTT